ncbi:MAG: fumarate hydratase [candidate division WOR-3 bacterium]
MKKIDKSVVGKIIQLYQNINLKPSSFVKKKIENQKTSNEVEKFFIDSYKENNLLSIKNKTPLCQDTGHLSVFIEIPENFCFGFDLESELRKSLNKETKLLGLRYSIVDNNGKYSNSPSVYIFQRKRKNVKIVLLAKGGGSENLSKLFMLNPSTTEDEIVFKIIESVKDAKDRGCPPYILGIGSGKSSLESVMLSKLALTGKFFHNKKYFEKRISEKVLEKSLDIKTGFMGLGFGKTVLDCRVIFGERHIATFPLSIQFNCYQERIGVIYL